jgi:hypothetical protein
MTTTTSARNHGASNAPCRRPRNASHRRRPLDGGVVGIRLIVILVLVGAAAWLIHSGQSPAAVAPALALVAAAASKAATRVTS